jgi:hypothetical protein
LDGDAFLFHRIAISQCHCISSAASLSPRLASMQPKFLNVARDALQLSFGEIELQSLP